MDPKVSGMLEDVVEAESLAELTVLESLIPEYPEVDVPAVRGSIEERRKTLSNFDPAVKVVELLNQIEQLKAEGRTVVNDRPAMKNIRRYKLIKTDVSWSNKPQVHVLMEIIKSIVEVDGVVDEDTILEAVERNKDLLNTRQSSARVFQYYKSAGGFIEHGNLEKVY